MKAVATALVLIAGAAVVLWYGNTLNSWVLGGLIGGLAALLLSIPISLTLFSYLSRRHDERNRAEAEEEAFLHQEYEYQARLPRRGRRVYDVENDAQYANEVAEYEDHFYEDDYHSPQHNSSRNLPVPSSSHLPMHNQSMNRLPAHQRRSDALAARPEADEMAQVQRKEMPERRTTRRIHYPGSPGYGAVSYRYNKHRSAALRAARQEAAYEDDGIEESPSHFSRSLPSATGYHQALSRYATPQQRASRKLSESTDDHARTRSRRVIDAPSASHNLPPAHNHAYLPAPHESDPQTDQIAPGFLQTGPIHRSARTDQLAHLSQEKEGSGSPETITGNLTRPLVRRAPYLYEDDPLRQELPQIDPPTIRRSSRLRERE
jgi:hypothetical protein